MASLYRPIDIKNGIFQNMYIDNKKFASITLSTVSSGSSQNIFIDDEALLMTDNTPNSSLTIKLSHHAIKLTHFSLYSCQKDNCFNSIDVLGSNNGEQWNEVCKIRTDDDYFLGKIALIECKSNLFYKTIKLIQAGKTNNQKDYFLFRYLEAFGYLSLQKHSRCICARHNTFLIYVMILLTK